MSIHGDPAARRTAFSDLAGGFRQASVILTANELGVFRALSAGAADMETLAKELDVSSRGLRLLLLALVGMDLLEMEDGKFALHGDAEEFLREGAPEYQGDIFRHNYRLMKRWVCLDEAVRKGGTPFYQEREERSDADLRAFILGMANISQLVVDELTDGLNLEGIRSILDIGGGPGTYLMAFLRCLPEAKGVLLDFPRVVDIAREQVKKPGMQSRIEYIEGDMFEAPFGGPYDMIFLGNIIHSCDEGRVRMLYQKCFNALYKGGRLVVKDFFLDENAARPMNGALFALNMLVGTEGGTAYRWIDSRNMMEETGLTIAQAFRVASHSGVLVGRKP